MSKKKRKKRLSRKHNPSLSRKELKQKAVDLMGGKCEYCSYSRSLHCLTFHHRDPNKKEFGISRLISSLPWAEVERELLKCHLLCLICHSEVHQGLIDGYIDGYQ